MEADLFNFDGRRTLAHQKIITWVSSTNYANEESKLALKEITLILRNYICDESQWKVNLPVIKSFILQGLSEDEQRDHAGPTSPLKKKVQNRVGHFSRQIYKSLFSTEPEAEASAVNQHVQAQRRLQLDDQPQAGENLPFDEVPAAAAASTKLTTTTTASARGADDEFYDVERISEATVVVEWTGYPNSTSQTLTKDLVRTEAFAEYMMSQFGAKLVLTNESDFESDEDEEGSDSDNELERRFAALAPHCFPDVPKTNPRAVLMRAKYAK